MQIVGLLWAALVLGLYFLPSLIAYDRRLRNPGPVAVVNVFLGWTVLGWVAALAMAFGEKKDHAVH